IILKELEKKRFGFMALFDDCEADGNEFNYVITYKLSSNYNCFSLSEK
ncbi:11596_t:CDS:1, partial [Gigaspora rosea]